VQVVCDADGIPIHASAPLPGRVHDRRAVALCGVEAVLGGNERLLVHADKGYIGTDFIVPRRSYKRHPLTPDQMAENREIGAIRCSVERGIAHLKVLDVLKSGIGTRSPRRNGGDQ
jgi:hypothetical protein